MNYEADHELDIKCCICKLDVRTLRIQMKCVSNKECIHSKSSICDLQGIAQTNNWYCPNCITEVFPFNHIIDQREFLEVLRDPLPESSRADFLNCLPKLRFALDTSDQRSLLNNDEIDPDMNSFNDIQHALYVPPSLLT